MRCVAQSADRLASGPRCWHRRILGCLCRREVERREVMQMQRLAFAPKHKQKLAKIARDAVEREEQLAVVKLETEAKMLAADRHRAEKRYVRIL